MYQLYGADKQRSYHWKLELGKIRLGRKLDCDLVISHKTVSRLHAEIEVLSDNSAVIKDLGSFNGTFVNNRRLTSPTALKIGDYISLGSMQLILTDDATSEAITHTLIELQMERSAAAKIQKELLNHVPTACPGFELDVYLEQCAAVGGDLYDIVHLPNGSMVIIVADVVGHGLGAALLMSHILASFRTLCLELNFELRKAIKTLSRLLCHHADDAQFASVVMGLLEPYGSVFRFINAGHNAPIIFRTDGSIVQLESAGPPIGILNDFEYAEDDTELSSGDMLLIYTDGLIETERNEEHFGEKRLVNHVIESPNDPLKQITDRIMDGVDRFIGDQPRHDDITLMMIRKV